MTKKCKEDLSPKTLGESGNTDEETEDDTGSKAGRGNEKAGADDEFDTPRT